MLNKIKVVVAVFALLGSTTAFANIIPLGDGLYRITDEQDVSLFLEEGDSHTVYHSLVDDGVPKDYWVIDGQLELSFSESEGDLAWDLDYEWARITSDGIEETLEVDGVWYNFHVIWVDLVEDAIASLNGSGELQVTVTAINDVNRPEEDSDFWWMTSKLKVDARRIPEPGTLSLLGLGLLGVAGARRLRK